MNCAIHDELVLIIINLVFILQLSIKLLNFRFYNKEHNVLNKEDNIHPMIIQVNVFTYISILHQDRFRIPQNHWKLNCTSKKLVE